MPAAALRLTHKRDILQRQVVGFCAHAARAHPFLSRKGCKSDPRGAPLDIPLIGARCFPGSMGGDFSPNPGGQHHWIPPGCSEKSSASAETARAPAESKTRPKFYLATLPRHPRLGYPLRRTAAWLRALPAHREPGKLTEVLGGMYNILNYIHRFLLF